MRFFRPDPACFFKTAGTPCNNALGGSEMKDIVEIRWHGRGGQGAKTASLLLADAAFNTGKYVQGFPEYGPERMGAPITAY